MRCSLERDDERTPPSISVSRTNRIALLLDVPCSNQSTQSAFCTSDSSLLHSLHPAPAQSRSAAHLAETRCSTSNWLRLQLTLKTEFLRTCESPGADSNLDPALTTTLMAPVGAPASEEATLTPAASETAKREAGVAYPRARAGATREAFRRAKLIGVGQKGGGFKRRDQQPTKARGFGRGFHNLDERQFSQSPYQPSLSTTQYSCSPRSHTLITSDTPSPRSTGDSRVRKIDDGDDVAGASNLGTRRASC
jgi:hypothetical protein